MFSYSTFINELVNDISFASVALNLNFTQLLVPPLRKIPDLTASQIMF